MTCSWGRIKMTFSSPRGLTARDKEQKMILSCWDSSHSIDLNTKRSSHSPLVHCGLLGFSVCVCVRACVCLLSKVKGKISSGHQHRDMYLCQLFFSIFSILSRIQGTGTLDFYFLFFLNIGIFLHKLGCAVRIVLRDGAELWICNGETVKMFWKESGR